MPVSELELNMAIFLVGGPLEKKIQDDAIAAAKQEAAGKQG